MSFLTGKIAAYVTGGLLVVIVALGLALAITRGALHRRTDALALEKTTHAADIARLKAATAKAQADDATHALAVENHDQKIAQEKQHDLETQLAEARAIAARWMQRHAAADNSGSGDQSPVPKSADATRDANITTAKALVSGADIDACVVDYTIASGWQDWWAKVSAAER